VAEPMVHSRFAALYACKVDLVAAFLVLWSALQLVAKWNIKVVQTANFIYVDFYGPQYWPPKINDHVWPNTSNMLKAGCAVEVVRLSVWRDVLMWTMLQEYERFRMPPMHPRHSKEAMKEHLKSQACCYFYE